MHTTPSIAVDFHSLIDNSCYKTIHPFVRFAIIINAVFFIVMFVDITMRVLFSSSSSFLHGNHWIFHAISMSAEIKFLVWFRIIIAFIELLALTCWHFQLCKPNQTKTIHTQPSYRIKCDDNPCTNERWEREQSMSIMGIKDLQIHFVRFGTLKLSAIDTYQMIH